MKGQLEILPLCIFIISSFQHFDNLQMSFQHFTTIILSFWHSILSFWHEHFVMLSLCPFDILAFCHIVILSFQLFSIVLSASQHICCQNVKRTYLPLSVHWLGKVYFAKELYIACDIHTYMHESWGLWWESQDWHHGQVMTPRHSTMSLLSCAWTWHLQGLGAAQ